MILTQHLTEEPDFLELPSFSVTARHKTPLQVTETGARQVTIPADQTTLQSQA